MKQLTTHSTSDLIDIAKEILATYPNERIFALHGNLGAGKTTLIKAFCRVLGVKDLTSSPSFAIINHYKSKSGDNVYHFDFYRINDIEEVLDIGYEDYFYSGDYCFLEWPEKIEKLLPENFVYIKITEAGSDGSRYIDVDHS